MKAAGKKEKGSRLERKVAELIRAKGLDKKASRMPLSGAMKHLPADIYTSLPIHIECKNQERIKLYEWWDLTRSKAMMPKEPVLIVKSNNRPILAVITIEYLLNLLKTEQDYIYEETERIEG